MKTLILIILSSLISFNAFAQKPNCEPSINGFEIACTFTTPAQMDEAYEEIDFQSTNCKTYKSDAAVGLHCVKVGFKQLIKNKSFASVKTPTLFEF